MSNNIYCTYLTTYSGDKLPPLYIGSTSVQKIEEEGYHGSVSSKKYKQIWLSELSENPHLFETQILTTHQTREEALEEEIRYQIEHNVVRSPEYINMAVAKKKFMSFNRNDPEYRKKLSESQKKRYENPEERKIQSLRSKGKKRTVEQSLRQSERQKIGWTEERRNEHSIVTKKGWTKEARKKMSDIQKKKLESKTHISQIKYTCEHCNKSIDKLNYQRWHGDRCKYFIYHHEI